MYAFSQNSEAVKVKINEIICMFAINCKTIADY